MTLNRVILGLVLSTVVAIGSYTEAHAQAGGQPSEAPSGDQAKESKEDEKPLKPRIRRGSKIVRNVAPKPPLGIDGLQSSQSVLQLRRHLTRIAELEHIGQLAKINQDLTLAARVNELLRLERKRYKYVVKRIKLYTQMKTQVGIP